jgi:tetratricopeptide (TPR) repeat protein
MSKKPRPRPTPAHLRPLATGRGGGMDPALEAATYNNRGVALTEMKRHGEALHNFDRAVALQPNHAEAHNNRGAVLQKLRRLAEARASYDRAIALKRDYANAFYNRGSLLKQMKQYDAALADFDAAIALNPSHVETHNNRGVLLQEMKLYAGALASFDRAIALKPNHVEAHANRGIVLVNQGDMRAAEKMFLRVLELKPDDAATWFSLVNIRQYDQADNADSRALRALLARPGSGPADQEYLHFSLGKIYDDCGAHGAAFACYRQANEIRNATVFYDARRVRRLTTALTEVFTRELMLAPLPDAAATRLPLFIVGMPRSGTTLLASILSQHPAIASAGELATLPDLIAELLDPAEPGVPYPSSARAPAPGVTRRLATEYERRLRRDTRSNTARVIDKNPLNFTHLGLIARVFPQAVVLHCTRHPLDTGLSNYFQRFSPDLSYSFDLANIGHFYGEYARLMAHWRQVLPLKMLEISYEDMVLHTETVIRRALEFLGLDWDERCLSPHTNPGPVESASQWQVRQPIYRRSLNRWRHYEKHLGPLKEVLEPPGLLPSGQI